MSDSDSVVSTNHSTIRKRRKQNDNEDNEDNDKTTSEQNNTEPTEIDPRQSTLTAVASFSRPWKYHAMCMIPLIPPLFLVATKFHSFLETGHSHILIFNILLSIFLGYLSTIYLIPALMPKLLFDAKLFGMDLAKPFQKYPVPESTGIVPATLFLICVIFSQFHRFGSFMPTEYNAATTSIIFMVFLGFADDVFNLKWRYKLVLPTVASLPLILAYGGSTTVVVPNITILRDLLGNNLDLGVIYHIYMLLLAVFCTNSINIYAGINGLEAGQSFVIACSILVHNVLEFSVVDHTDDPWTKQYHLFSLFIIIPFIATTCGLLYYNWYPSLVFVGDTYTYFAGMTFAVVGILGHFSKTLLLFFIPQILNFVLSLPQVLHIIPCPRHRVPRFDANDNRMHCVTNHHTLLNLFLFFTGPLTEQQLSLLALGFQILCSCIALYIRYFVASQVYGDQLPGLF